MWHNHVCRAFISEAPRCMFLPTQSRYLLHLRPPLPPFIVSVRMSSRWRSDCGRAGLSWCGGQTLIAAQLCTQPRMWALWQLSGFDVYRVTLALPPLIPARNYGRITRASMLVMPHGERSSCRQTVAVKHWHTSFFFNFKIKFTIIIFYFTPKIKRNHRFYKG